jgi:dihydrofolate reductase
MSCTTSRIPNRCQLDGTGPPGPASGRITPNTVTPIMASTSSASAAAAPAVVVAGLMAAPVPYRSSIVSNNDMPWNSGPQDHGSRLMAINPPTTRVAASYAAVRGHGRRWQGCCSPTCWPMKNVGSQRPWRSFVLDAARHRVVGVALLLYSTNTSLDGYIEDTTGDFGFTMPSDEVHAFINDRLREVATHLYGRRLYETMAVWETDPSFAEGPPVARDFAAIWQAADKVVYSTTLPDVVTTRTRIERAFAPDEIRALKAAADRDLLVGGAELAGRALRHGLVDEVHLYVAPVAVGGGKPALPPGLRLDLNLLDERRFGNGTLYLRYGCS